MVNKMVLLPGLLFILLGEPARNLAEDGGFTFPGEFRSFAVATNTVYIATEERLYQLSHDLTPVQSLSQRGVLRDSQFHRVPDADEEHVTFSVNILLPFVHNETLISCGMIDCGYCEVLDLNDISNVRYSEHIQVGPLSRNSASISLLVDVEKSQSQSQTYILTAIEQNVETSAKPHCPFDSGTVNLHNTNDKQGGGIFSTASGFLNPMIRLVDQKNNVDFVDGFQINSSIYVFSNLPSRTTNRVHLIWLDSDESKDQTLRSLRGATLSISDRDTDSRLLASSVIPGGLPVLWSGVFSVSRGETNTELVMFDISPDLMGPDQVFCYICPPRASASKPLKVKTVLLRKNNMTSLLAVRQKAWMVFFIGTEDGQLIKLAVDKNYQTTCPRVLYRANDERKVFPKIQLDPVHGKHLYVPFQNQMKRVPVSKCSTYTTLQDCWSAQDPYCVWCNSKRCSFEDECQGSDWLSIPDDVQQKMVSYKVVKDQNDQVTLYIKTHVTVGQEAQANFACQFRSTSELCSSSSRPQFPQCSCILKNNTLPAEGLPVTVRIRLGTTTLSENLELRNCLDISGPPTFALCQQCIKAGCNWKSNYCGWADDTVQIDAVCQRMESSKQFPKPEISSISPSVVSFYGKNHAVLTGQNLHNVTRVRIQADVECTWPESPVWNNNGVSLTFHIPTIDFKGVVKVCVVLPDGSCHGNAQVVYQSSPICTSITPNTSWISGMRKITLMGSHMEFVEGIVHSHAMEDVRPPRFAHFQNLTYDTPAAGQYGIFTSSVFLKVANETLPCSTKITYYPEPSFINLTSTRIGDGVQIIIQMRANKLEITTEELSVWAVHGKKEYPCVVTAKKNRNQEDFFICDIQNTGDIEFQKFKINYCGITLTKVTTSSMVNVILILRLLMVPFVIAALVIVCCWQKKVTDEMNKR